VINAFGMKIRLRQHELFFRRFREKIGALRQHTNNEFNPTMIQMQQLSGEIENHLHNAQRESQWLR